MKIKRELNPQLSTIIENLEQEHVSKRRKLIEEGEEKKNKWLGKTAQLLGVKPDEKMKKKMKNIVDNEWEEYKRRMEKEIERLMSRSVRCQRRKSFLENEIKKLFADFGPFVRVSSMRLSDSWLEVGSDRFRGKVFLQNKEGKRYTVEIEGRQCILKEEK